MIKYALLTFLLLFPSLNAFDLAIDTGHTSTKEGAKSCRCVGEYHYNRKLSEYLEFALQLKKINVYRLNTQTPTFQQRYELSHDKDLFVSIHHDSVQPSYIIRGDNGCPQTSHAKGFSIFISKKNRYHERSLSYAKAFAHKLIDKGFSPSLHHAEQIVGENRELIDSALGIYCYDDLKVLKHADSPAFLFEAGVIVNPQDEHDVQNKIYYDAVAEAILEAVGNH